MLCLTGVFVFFNTVRVFFYGVVLQACLQCFDAVGWAAGRASGL